MTSCFGRLVAIAVCAATLLPGLALADDGSGAASPPMPYSLLNPTPDSALRSLNNDRPTKSNVPGTVDGGRFQIETDFANFTYADAAGVKTRSFEALDPAFKLGITSSVELDVEFNGLQSLSVGDNTMPTMHGEGFGDIFFRSKINLLGNDGGNLSVALIPYVKAPSQRALISNGAVEGGLIIPISYKLPSDFVLLVDPEFDALKNAFNSGRHANFTNLVNLSHAVPGLSDLTAFAEFFASVLYDRSLTNIYTADFALAYAVSKNVEVDLGTNIGLNRAAPNVQIYSGGTVRF